MELRKLLPVFATGLVALTACDNSFRNNVVSSQEIKEFNNTPPAIIIKDIGLGRTSPSVTLGDVNNDGFNDLIIAKKEGDYSPDTKVYIFYNDGKGNFSTTNNYNPK